MEKCPNFPRMDPGNIVGAALFLLGTLLFLLPNWVFRRISGDVFAEFRLSRIGLTLFKGAGIVLIVDGILVSLAI